MANLSNQPNSLAAQARNIFASQVASALPELARAILDKLSHALDQPGSAPELQARRDAWLAFQTAGKAWVNGTNKSWKFVQTKFTQPSAALADVDVGNFQLMDNDVMEGRILASRLALRLLDVATWELSDLRLRVQHLEQISELDAGDILRPEVQARLMVEQWTEAGLSRDAWITVQDVIQTRMVEHLLDSYHAANEYLVQNGVMVEIDLRPLVKRTPSAVVNAPLAGKDSPSSLARANSSSSPQPRSSSSQGNTSGPGGSGSNYSDDGGTRGGSGGSGAGSGGGGAGSGRSGASSSGATKTAGVDNNGVSGSSKDAPATRSAGSAFEETRMLTATSPLARARMRAQGVMGTLKRLLTNQVAGFDDTRGAHASPQLAQALARAGGGASSGHTSTLVGYEPVDGEGFSQQHVAQASTALRQQTSTLKKAASTSAEKATIEIVALMFQAILAEDRIPPAVRVWFARLQMPVLRLAISEPEFFGTLEHPARRLIDRMGSCVLGFDVAVSGSAMEVEIKRIVQVIEQYPETGRRVFQLVYDEFQKFLSKFLSENVSNARVVSIAQQVEQKETMAIQYTIEMRKMLNDMPVRDEIREFLFKIWAEVLALAAMRNGAQHEQTITLKRAASNLVWAASAKPNRADRAKVIADLPKLLQLLRLGMTMLAMNNVAQDQQLKIISDTLADAFMSKTGAISAERIDAMAKRLTNLEDYLSDEDVGDLPLDTEALVMMIGIDASDIEVVTDGGSQPTEAMRAWAQELQLGAWFSLDHNGRSSTVQFAWRSDRKQLHLFASSDGRNFLIQARRLAAYLQAGLLLPIEEEALTVRATRDALAKLEANPERLLN